MEEKRSDRYKRKKFSSKTIILLSGLVILCIAVMVGGYFLIPQIKLNGDRVVTLNYKEKYKEEGFSGSYLNENITDEIEVKGKVDPNKLGTYEITYTYKKGWIKKKVVRKVVVEDTSKPVIEVSENKNIYLCPGSKYKKEKVKAYDNYDGDLSNKVKIDVSSDEVIYSVEDSSGNETKVKKKLIFEDNEAPKLTLIGG